MDVNQALSTKQQSIVPIAAFTANGDLDKLRTALNDGLDAGLTVNEIKEILVHLYAYAGFPRSLNGINTFMALMDERRTKGIEDDVGRRIGRRGPPARELRTVGGDGVAASLLVRGVDGVDLSRHDRGVGDTQPRHLVGQVLLRGRA